MDNSSDEQVRNLNQVPLADKIGWAEHRLIESVIFLRDLFKTTIQYSLIGNAAGIAATLTLLSNSWKQKNLSIDDFVLWPLWSFTIGLVFGTLLLLTSLFCFNQIRAWDLKNASMLHQGEEDVDTFHNDPPRVKIYTIAMGILAAVTWCAFIVGVVSGLMMLGNQID